VGNARHEKHPHHRPLLADGKWLGHPDQPVGVEQVKIKPGSPTFPAWGWNLKVVDQAGKDMPVGEKGFLVAIPQHRPVRS